MIRIDVVCIDILNKLHELKWIISSAAVGKADNEEED